MYSLSMEECHSSVLQHLPILHDVQVPQLHHLFLPLIDICELVQLLNVAKHDKL